MEKYILSCCSTADLTKEHFEAIDVKYICFHYELEIGRASCRERV